MPLGMPRPPQPVQVTRSWVRAGLAIAAIGAVAATTAALLTRWPIADPALRSRVLRGIEEASGLSATASGAMSFRLLPRPTIEIRSVAIQGMSGAIALEADALRGRLDLGALMEGRFHVAASGFDNPTIVLDADRLQPLVQMLLGHGAGPASLAPFYTSGVTLHGGVIRLLSRDHHRDTLLTDVSASVAWPADTAEASLTGSATWRGINGQFGIDIDSLAAALRGGDTLASATLKSSALDVDLEGTLSGHGDVLARGKINATTLDLPAFLRVIGMPSPQLVGVHHARLDASAVVTGDTLALDPTTLGLDEMVFDGALSIHERAGRTSLAGTLATESIELDPFFEALPVVLSPEGDWSTVPLGTRAFAYDDIDLRISASAARFRSFLMEDCSLSLQSGDGRMELSIGEARAYDGLLKGRIVAALEDDATDIRAEATLSRLDVNALTKAAPGGYKARGTITSHIALGAKGLTPADLVRDASGRGQFTVRDGEIGGKLLAAIVRAAPGAKRVAMPLAAGATPFDTASLDIAVEHGTASLTDSWITWPAARAAIEGSASLPGQTLALRARVSPFEGDDASESETVYDLKGSWHDLLLKPVRPRS